MEKPDKGSGRASLVAPDAAPAPLRSLHAFWDLKRGDRPFPAREELPTEELWPWVSRINMVEPVGEDFRYLVFGTEIANRIRRDWTGRLLSEMDPADTGVAIAAMFRRAVETQAPVWFRTAPRNFEGRQYAWWRVVLPLGRDGRVERLLVGVQEERA